MLIEYTCVGAAWGLINIYRAYTRNKDDPFTKEIADAQEKIAELGISPEKALMVGAIVQFPIAVAFWPISVIITIYKMFKGDNK